MIKINLVFFDSYHALFIGLHKYKYLWTMSFRFPECVGNMFHTLHRIRQYGVRKGLQKPWKHNYR